ncbi:MAG: hypothetical protein AB8I08_37025 [Sandaracinaceae bacterium]
MSIRGAKAAAGAVCASGVLLAAFAAHAQPPTPRRELAEERTRFRERERAYQASLRQHAAFRDRSHDRRLSVRYAPALLAEARAATEARAEAIAELESFVAQHPDDPQHTPGALLRLAELRLVEALERAEGTRPLDLAVPLAIAQRVAREFRSAPHRSRAAYLAGWCLAATDRDEEAAAAWRRAVCDGGGDEYTACPSADGELAVEMFLRLGRHHARRGELRAARGAYAQVAAHPTHRLAARGSLESAALARRSADAEGALRILSRLLERQTAEAVRSEALALFAAILCDEDWDLDGRPDHAAGGAHPLERLEDRRLFPHDRDWTGDVYLRVGLRLHRARHPDEARMAWRLAERHAPRCAAGLRALRMRLPSSVASVRAEDLCATAP